MQAVFIIICIRSVFPEDQPVLVKVDSLLETMKHVAKKLVGLINVVLHCEHAVVIKILPIKIIKCLTVLCVVHAAGLDALNKSDVSVTAPCPILVFGGLGAILY